MTRHHPGALTPDELDEIARGWREESLAAMERMRKLVRDETARAIIKHAERETTHV